MFVLQIMSFAFFLNQRVIYKLSKDIFLRVTFILNIVIGLITFGCTDLEVNEEITSVPSFGKANIKSNSVKSNHYSDKQISRFASHLRELSIDEHDIERLVNNWSDFMITLFNNDEYKYRELLKRIARFKNLSIASFKTVVSYPSLFILIEDDPTLSKVAKLVTSSLKYSQDRVDCTDHVISALMIKNNLWSMHAYLDSFNHNIRAYCALVTDDLDLVDLMFISPKSNSVYDTWVRNELKAIERLDSFEERFDRLMFGLNISERIRFYSTKLSSAKLTSLWQSILELGEGSFLVSQPELTRKDLWRLLSEDTLGLKLIQTVGFFVLNVKYGQLRTDSPQLIHFLEYATKYPSSDNVNLIRNLEKVSKFKKFNSFLTRDNKLPHHPADLLLVKDVAKWLNTCKPKTSKWTCACSDSKPTECLNELVATPSGIRAAMGDEGDSIIPGADIYKLLKKGFQGRPIKGTDILFATMDILDFIPGGGIASEVGSTAVKKTTKTVLREQAERILKSEAKDSLEEIGEQIVKRQSKYAKKLRSFNKRYAKNLTKTNKSDVLDSFVKSTAGQLMVLVKVLRKPIKAAKRVVHKAERMMKISTYIEGVYTYSGLSTYLSPAFKKKFFSIYKASKRPMNFAFAEPGMLGNLFDNYTEMTHDAVNEFALTEALSAMSVSSDPSVRSKVILVMKIIKKL